MIEKTILDYLSARVDVPVYLEVPHPDEGSYITIEKSGGGREELVYTGLITVRCFADSLYEAAVLAETVQPIMLAIDELDDVVSCELNSAYAFPDTRTKRYRYQSVYDLVYY